MTQEITRRITLNLVAGIVVTLLSVGSALWWMAEGQNQQARHSTRLMVAGGISSLERRVNAIAFRYAQWEEAYEAYQRGDRNFATTAYGFEVTRTGIADVMAVVPAEGAVDPAWLLDRDRIGFADLLSRRNLAAIRSFAEGLPAGAAARFFYMEAGRRVLLLAVARLSPVSRAAGVNPETLPLFVAGLALTDERLADIGRSFLIDDLRLSPRTDENGEGFLPIRDPGGRVVASLAWTPPRPGHASLGAVAPPVGVALALFCAIALVIGFGARRLTLALTASEEEAQHAARHDPLTGLLNRAGFGELLESREETAAGGEGALAMIYIDVNGFKSVNDSIGHQGGDELIRALAERLAAVLPPGARLARIGGDEFAVMLSGRQARDMVAGAASALVHAFDRPFTVAGFEFHVTAAIGHASASRSGTEPAEVLRRADLAMYQAKNAAEREAVAYHPTMETGALEKKQVETALRRAVEAGELSVVYQPIVRSGDLSVVSLEALVRWDSREFGPIAPALFVPVAEETGLIHEIGSFVISRACQDLRDWPDLKITVNVSPVQLRDPNFADDLLALIGRYGVAPQKFDLELTEGILVSNPAIAKRKLAALKELGFSLSLDDFGTGFSSIGYLRQFPFDRLKVDRSFVREVGVNPTANALIQALVSLGDAMDLEVVAEGIENEEQLTLLRLVQCEYLQGFFISTPVPAGEIAALLARTGADRRLPPRIRTIPPRLVSGGGL